MEIKTFDRICFVVVVVISLVSGYWTVSRNVKQLREIRQEKKLLSGSLTDFDLAETNVHRLNAAIVETKKQLKTLNERIPDSAKIGEFLRQLNGVMRERELVLESFQPQPAVEKRLFTRLPIRLISRGAFANIYTFLYDLEKMNRLVDVEKIIITRIGADQSCRLEMITNIFER